ncbi:hypothetical protein GCM10007874_50010 [Labrys miyagiensis]|uniref:Uncharacterized protein n=1 Tax=Labrys miyagiensis TaxID=346912 RepID=A0ABQ6CP97_9HYPH|nr:hypothetical protein [Labrys miyagiensis]GLS21984.1 hypothetical protein GCM10007874_50010 [Labrys miyagiensis]
MKAIRAEPTPKPHIQMATALPMAAIRAMSAKGRTGIHIPQRNPSATETIIGQIENMLLSNHQSLL